GEGLVERVGEDEGGADHPGAEHDRERGEDGAGLAAEQSFERDGNHRPLTSCMAASTSAAVEPRTSLTIWPSARKRIRSASAAALASWVTITVVAAEPGQLLVVHAGDLDAGDRDAALARLVEPGEDVHQRRLARARRAHDRGQAGLLDLERDVAERVHGRVALAVAAGEAARGDDGR